jgi:hypothetical protein
MGEKTSLLKKKGLEGELDEKVEISKELFFKKYREFLNVQILEFKKKLLSVNSDPESDLAASLGNLRVDFEKLFQGSIGYNRAKLESVFPMKYYMSSDGNDITYEPLQTPEYVAIAAKLEKLLKKGEQEKQNALYA